VRLCHGTKVLAHVRGEGGGSLMALKKKLERARSREKNGEGDSLVIVWGERGG